MNRTHLFVTPIFCTRQLCTVFVFIWKEKISSGFRIQYAFGQRFVLRFKIKLKCFVFESEISVWYLLLFMIVIMSNIYVTWKFTLSIWTQTKGIPANQSKKKCTRFCLDKLTTQFLNHCYFWDNFYWLIEGSPEDEFNLFKKRRKKNRVIADIFKWIAVMHAFRVYIEWIQLKPKYCGSL